MKEPSDKKWFFLKPNVEESIGPISADELWFLFTENKINKQTLVWTEGMSQWEEFAKVDALQAMQKTVRIKPSITTHGTPKPGSGTPPTPHS